MSRGPRHVEVKRAGGVVVARVRTVVEDRCDDDDGVGSGGKVTAVC